MYLAFYEAKLGQRLQAESDLKDAEEKGASDLYSQFRKAQVLALLGKQEEALQLVLLCIDKGLSTADVDLALDLNEIRKDPRYLRHITQAKSKP